MQEKLDSSVREIEMNPGSEADWAKKLLDVKEATSHAEYCEDGSIRITVVDAKGDIIIEDRYGGNTTDYARRIEKTPPAFLIKRFPELKAAIDEIRKRQELEKKKLSN